MKCLTIIIFLVNFTVLHSVAQYVNPDVRRGNREFKSENYTEAEMNYRKALEENPQSLKALYNLASALYKQGRYDEAANLLDGISRLDVPDNRQADIYHNLGNARLGNQQIQEGIEAYKNALRLRPHDNDTRHNLAMAMQLLQEQDEQQQQDGDDQQDDQEQQPQDGDDEQQDEQQQEPQPRPDQISPEDAQRILDALKQQEQEIQEKIEREERQRRPERPLREW